MAIYQFTAQRKYTDILENTEFVLTTRYAFETFRDYPKPTEMSGKIPINFSEVWIRSLRQNILAVNLDIGKLLVSIHEQIAYLVVRNFYVSAPVQQGI